MKRRRTLNPKRRLAEPPVTGQEQELLALLAERATYGGNPEHKRDPGDFDLDPPARPRPGKTLCDGVGVSRRAEAERLLREGIRRGLISAQRRNDWPQNVWALAENGMPLEAQLENEETGVYHGYPMATGDPLFQVVVSRWINA